MMRNLFFGFMAASMAFPAMAADFNKPIEQAITGYIRPATAEFAESASKLPAAVKAICAETTEATVEGLKSSFSETVRDYSRVHFLRFGPLLENDRLNRLSFLPDPRGTAQRQIRKIYAAHDESVLSLGSLQNKSVAVQSMTAFELIAFNKSTDVVLGEAGDNKDYTCGYALAIAENVAEIAGNLASDWADPNGFSKVLLSAGPENERFRSPTEALEAVFNSLVTGIIIAKDQDVLPALGSSEEKAKPRRFPYSRSGNSILYVSAELDGINDAVASMELKEYMSPDNQWIMDTLGFEFKNANNYLAQLQPPLRKTFGEEGSYNQAKALVVNLTAIQDMMGQEVAGALGLAGGFNALDGD
ncbi:MAG: imelysin family protein [Pseudomonadota bacterium]